MQLGDLAVPIGSPPPPQWPFGPPRDTFRATTVAVRADRGLHFKRWEGFQWDRFDALLRPKRKADGTYTFTWFQLGGVVEAEPIGPRSSVAAKWVPSEEQLKDYLGNYPLTSGFALRIFATGDRLFVQGTNQPSLELASVERDVFVAESVAAEIDFARDADGKVVALTLKQRGQVLKGERH